MDITAPHSDCLRDRHLEEGNNALVAGTGVHAVGVGGTAGVSGARALSQSNGSSVVACNLCWDAVVLGQKSSTYEMQRTYSVRAVEVAGVAVRVGGGAAEGGVAARPVAVQCNLVRPCKEFLCMHSAPLRPHRYTQAHIFTVRHKGAGDYG